jgi:hypothetical protein
LGTFWSLIKEKRKENFSLRKKKKKYKAEHIDFEAFCDPECPLASFEGLSLTN